VTGLEVLLLIWLSTFAFAAPVAVWAIDREWGERKFLRSARRSSLRVEDVQIGGVDVPLTFMVTSSDGNRTRVSAVLRGDTPLWHLERVGDDPRVEPLVVVEKGWRAPEQADLPVVGTLSMRLEVKSNDSPTTRALIDRSGADLFRLLERNARRLVVNKGRAFLEVRRRGLDVREALDALCRLDGLIAVLKGERYVLPEPEGERVAAPDGAPIALPSWPLP
jgi:hypothetical protein